MITTAAQVIESKDIWHVTRQWLVCILLLWGFCKVFVFEFGHYKYSTIPEDEEEDFIKFLDYIIRTVVHQAAKNSRKGVGFIADFEDFLPGHFNTPGGKPKYSVLINC